MASTSGAVSFKLVGFSALERRLKAMPKRIENACFRKALRTAVTKLAKKMRAGTPVGATGRAKKSVKVKVRVRGKRAYAQAKYTRLGWTGEFHGTKGTKDPGPPLYMRIYDQGGSRQPARPYMAAALGNWRAESQADFLQALRAAVEKNEG